MPDHPPPPSATPPPGEGDCPRGRRCDRKTVLTALRVPASIADIAYSLVALERPAAVTENHAARLTQIGAYAPPSEIGGPFLVDPGRATVRLHTDAVTGAFLVRNGDGEGEGDADGDARPELRLHGPGEVPAHRCYALQDADKLILDGLTRDGGALSAPAPGVRYPVAAQTAGELPDQLERLDDLLTRSARHSQFIPHRHVDPGVLGSVLDHARDVRLPLGVAVLSSAALHAVQDRIVTVSQSSDLTVVAMREVLVEIALPVVRQCIHLRLHGVHGPTSMLELYDGRHECVALITQFGIVGADVHAAWEHLAESLPEIW